METKGEELKNKSKEELEIMLREKRSELVSDKFSASARQLKNIDKIKKNKRAIARIFTVLKQQKEEQSGKGQANK